MADEPKPKKKKEAPQFEITEVKDLIAATILWEREFDDEKERAEAMMHADMPPLPPEMPDEAKEQVEAWFKQMRSRVRDRVARLSNLLPERQEAATNVRWKLFQLRNALMDELTDKL